ncbi:hypothetical protein [Streptomyces microflavus]|uniref:hypothetical protein n=1 Tax=Streptomyces microflavus TaxID=1919 RepID=UPI003695EAE9
MKRIAATGIIHTPPVPLPDGSPGDPIRARRLDNTAASVPGGENRLVLHRSEGADGSPVATSGVIAVPDRTAHPVPAGGYPVVSWAHGTVPVRITQAGERVRADPAPLPGTDALVEELTATNGPRRNIHYRRYEPGAVPADEPLGIHDATIDHDTAELTEWLAALLEDAAHD